MADAGDILKQFPDEELHWELERHVHEEPFGDGTWYTLTHPLVYAVPYFPQMNHYHNAALSQKKKMIEAAVDNQDWHSFVFLHERPHRLEALVTIIDDLGDAGEAMPEPELIISVWMDSENIWQNTRRWDSLLRELNLRQQDDRGMDPDDLLALQEMDEKITIYRGWTRKDRTWGWSWSLDRERAEWFARRFRERNEKAYVTAARVRSDDVLAFLTGRNEEEILIDPKIAQESTTITTLEVRG